mgnify:CR=1 FL=1
MLLQLSRRGREIVPRLGERRLELGDAELAERDLGVLQRRALLELLSCSVIL